MKVALGFKSHSGWAALVAIGKSRGDLEVVDRRRIELIDDGGLWAKKPSAKVRCSPFLFQ